MFAEVPVAGLQQVMQLWKISGIELTSQGLEETVQVIMTGCFGFCEKGPIVKVMPDNTFYVGVTPEDAGDHC